MKIVARSTLIITLIFVMRTLTGCFNYECPDGVYYFDFTGIRIQNLDNTGIWPKVMLNDTMKREAVSFQIEVSGDNRLLGKVEKTSFSFGFPGAYAWSKEYCPPVYEANQKIDNLTIVSLLRLTENIPSNTDVTDIFLATEETSYQTDLYVPITKLYQKINHTYIEYPKTGFRLFLGRGVENDSAQFIIKVRLADNTILADTTRVIHIR